MQPEKKALAPGVDSRPRLFAVSLSLVSQPNWRRASQVVVTGLGTLTSLGHDPHTFFDKLVEGECGIDFVTRFDAEKWEVPSRIVSEVKDFDVSEYWAPKDAKRCAPPHLPARLVCML